MAFTSTVIHKTVYGDRRIVHFEVTADANSGSVDSGMLHVTSVLFGPISMASGSEAKLKRNLSAASAASNGIVMCSGFTNGDAFTCVVYGK